MRSTQVMKRCVEIDADAAGVLMYTCVSSASECPTSPSSIGWTRPSNAGVHPSIGWIPLINWALIRGKFISHHRIARARKYEGRCKQRAIIFHGGRVIANFVPNFIAMATGVDQGKI